MNKKLTGGQKQSKPKTPGGKRKGAGRPKGEPKKAIGKRVPIRFHKHFVELIKTELSRLNLKT